jgi:hypothetical protein
MTFSKTKCGHCGYTLKEIEDGIKECTMCENLCFRSDKLERAEEIYNQKQRFCEALDRLDNDE